MARKYKKGDIIVKTRDDGWNRNTMGNIHAIRNVDHYGYHIGAGSYPKAHSIRLATPEEARAYSQGIKNIRRIVKPKETDVYAIY